MIRQLMDKILEDDYLIPQFMVWSAVLIIAVLVIGTVLVTNLVHQAKVMHYCYNVNPEAASCPASDD